MRSACPDRYVQPSFAAVVNGKEVSFKGRTKPFSESLETTFDITISDLVIPHYLEYVPVQREYEIPSAFLDVKAVVSFTQHKDKPPTLSAQGDVIFKEVRISGKDKSPMVHLPRVKAVISPSDLVARDFHLAALQVQDPEIDVSIDRNGTLNLLSLLPNKQKESEVEEKEKKIAPEGEAGGKDQKFTVDSIRLTGGKVRFADASHGSPFKTALGELRIDVNGLGTGKGTKADALVSFSTEAGETVELKGNLSLSPLASEGTIALVKKQITIGGIATAKGSISVRRNAHRPVLREVRGPHDGSSSGDRPRPAPAKGGEHRHRRKTAWEILLRHPL